ncbi:group II intron maturase-specific domain-containing protein [Sporosarcina ureilytica]|uniref:group II intron maturase-specific domain-containing protein n=1 Tax=Sporosarcina ureilytica TaxID=298596 RepID=UPI0012DB1B02
MWRHKSLISRFQHPKSHGKVGCRPSRSAKQRLKAKLEKLTSRKRPGTFGEIIKKINQTTTGWINYYGIANMKTFIETIQQWLNHRLRQLIWKRWKKVRTTQCFVNMALTVTTR